MQRGMLVALFALLASCVEAAPVREPAAVSLHAYYLFLCTGSGSGYVPLLVTREPLEALAASGTAAQVVLVTTYERDSIWSLERDVRLDAAQVLSRKRGVQLRDLEYRYQEIAPAEVLRLLNEPSGTMPIHRRVGPPRRDEIQDLIAGFGGGSGR